MHEQESKGEDYEYGVQHVIDGKEDNVTGNLWRSDAEADVRECRANDEDCYLVRRVIPRWERVQG